ncbi:Metal-dependent hydrolase related to alanyl-tRNA synthetase [Spironucleus salmonicida]|uniref:Metal-dependent hydrolase related to alanyl-tRNA synthetase n=1 Tax=Spironucleus salmonicida TaxID=348837 RepID=V6LX92_9EUKA|nr:Metal-dependent hydrolase related to alanyl-tRNA synthetase [Spironucleus salmonicida]|eukprot:EST49160.1 Metal-dependent hydrolase related to alanyl-tRNA synthetase [Spironucleus salmonicida]
MFAYTENIYTFEATATSIPQNDKFAISLVPNFLFSGGGGQLPDCGTINDIPFTLFSGDSILMDKDISGVVIVKISENRRRNSSLLHTGQHLLSAEFERMHNAKSSSFTAFEDYATIELNIKLSQKQIDEVEENTNLKIAKGAGVEIKVFTQESDEIPQEYRSGKLKFPFRLVSIIGLDSCGCCGTHVSDISELQICKVLSVENVKAGIKIEFSFGGQAIQKLNSSRNELLRISKHLTTGEFDVFESVKAMQAELKATKKRNSEVLKVLSRYLMCENVTELKDFKSIFVQSISLENADIQPLLASLLKEYQNACVFNMSGNKLKVVFGSNQKRGGEVLDRLKSVIEVVGGGSAVRVIIEVAAKYEDVLTVFKTIFD